MIIRKTKLSDVNFINAKKFTIIVSLAREVVTNPRIKLMKQYLKIPLFDKKLFSE